MIKLFAVRIGQTGKIDWYTKKATQRMLTKQMDKGIRVTPNPNEYRTLYMTIEDKPLTRFFMKLLKKDDKNLPVRVDAEFARSIEQGVSPHCLVKYSDSVPMHQINELKKGKNLLNKKDSFVSILTKKINEALKENNKAIK